MFKSIAYRKSPYIDHGFDIGLLAECLLFYNKVNIFADIPMLSGIAREIGLDTLEELIDSGKVRFVFSPFLNATRTYNEFTPYEIFDYCSIVKVDKAHKEPDVEGLFMETLARASQKKGKSRRVGNRIYKKIEKFEPKTDFPFKKGIHDISRLDLTNMSFVENAIITIIKHYSPEYKFPYDFFFKVNKVEKGFKVFSNIDMADLNKSCGRTYRKDSTDKLTMAHLLDHILKVNQELYISSFFDSEITTDQHNSKLIELKLSNIVKNLHGSQEKVTLFQEVVFDEGKTIRESINSGNHSFSTIMPLLGESEKFNKWTSSLGKDSNLIKEYYRSITAKSWIDSLPAKAVRFSLFTGAGLVVDAAFPTGIGTTSGIALGLGDSFLLDKMVKGWKPDQFIQQVQKKMK